MGCVCVCVCVCVKTQESAPLPVFQHLSEEELSGMYNEWMKIAADNVRSNRNNPL